MVAPESNLSGLLRGTALGNALSHDSAELVILRPDGRWHLQQGGHLRLQQPVPTASAEALFRDLPDAYGAPCGHRWWVHRVPGILPIAIFRLRPRADRGVLSPQSLELLRSKIPRDANGVVFGPDASSRAGLLLSLTRFLPTELPLFIGSCPPIPPEDLDLLHLFPPTGAADRLTSRPLVDRATTILIDGALPPEDLRPTFADHTTNRWIALRDLADLSAVPGTRYDVRVGVIGAATEPARLTHLSVRTPTGWEVLLDDSHLDDDLPERTIQSSPRISAQITSPVKSLGRIDSSAEVSDFDVATLLEDDIEELDSSLLESGEIDVPGFVSRRFEDEGSTTNAELSAARTKMLQGNRMDRELPYLIAQGDVDAVEIPEVQIEQLRQTMDSSYDPKRLEAFRTMRRHSLEEKSRPDPDTRTTSEETPGAPRRIVASRSGTLQHGNQRAVPAPSSPRILPTPSEAESEISEISHVDDDPPTQRLDEISNPTEELEFSDLLEDLKRRRRAKSESSD